MIKKLTLSAFMVLSCAYMFGQSPRLVLFEEFTSASCYWCGFYNPAFQALLNANTSKCTSIKYQSSYGYDPMYLHNPSESSARGSYYDVPGYPDCVMDGNAFHGSPASVTQTMINNRYAVTSPFELKINQQLSPGNDSIYVTMLGKATGDASGSLASHCVVIEKHIHFNTAPGTNGEKDFYNVMKKMLPDEDGTTLASNFTNGDYFIIEQSWKLANVYNNDELSVVGFIQNNQNAAILQSANTSATPIQGIYANDVELMKLTNVTPTYCNNSISPVVTIRNNGSTPLTSLMLQYGANGTLVNYLWTGNLGFLGKATIQLPTAAFTLKNNNDFVLYASSTNAVNDEYPKNDTLHYTFTSAIQAGTTATVKIKTDNNPEETTWSIAEADGNVIASGGPYSGSATIYTQEVPLDFGTCYVFTIYDAGGNGLCCSNGAGYYRVSSGTTLIEFNNQFGASESTQFYSQSGVDVPAVKSIGKASIYPNPVSGITTLSYTCDKPEIISIEVFDLLGNKVINLPLKQYGSGQHDIALDFSKLPSGLYNVRILNGEKSQNLKVTVAR